MKRSPMSAMRRACLAAACAATFPVWAQHSGHSMPGGAMPMPAPTWGPATGTQNRSDTSTPRPPENTSGPMSMPVSDNMIFHQLLLDQVEYTRTRHGGSGLAWDLQGWVGRDYNRLWIKSEGARQGGRTEDARVELLWSRPVAAFWDLQAGVRHDFGEGPSRNWLAAGIQGVAPYWFDVEATAYLASAGRAALRLKTEYNVVVTQRTFLVPALEANLYSKSDPDRGIGSGLSDLSFGLRLRHEIRREFAPYIGVNWTHRFGGTAALARVAGQPTTERQFVVGVRSWF